MKSDPKSTWKLSNLELYVIADALFKVGKEELESGVINDNKRSSIQYDLLHRITTALQGWRWPHE